MSGSKVGYSMSLSHPMFVFFPFHTVHSTLRRHWVRETERAAEACSFALSGAVSKRIEEDC